MHALVAIAMACLAIAFAHRQAHRHGGVTLDATVIALAQFLATVGVASTALGLARSFTATFFAQVCFVLAVLVVRSTARAGPPPITPSPIVSRTRATLFALFGILALGAALRLPPMPAPLAGHDQGTYRLRAEHQAKSGRLMPHDGMLEEFSDPDLHGFAVADLVNLYPGPESPVLEDWYEAPYRPGFYLRDRDTGAVTPQFFHLHPSVLAAFALASPDDTRAGIGVATWLEGLLALMAFAAVARRLIGERWALLALLLLSIAPIAVWTHRNPLSECLIAGLAWAGALALFGSRDPDGREGPADSAMTGAWLLGAATWVRGDAWLWGVAMALAWRTRANNERERRPPRTFALCLAAGAAVHAWSSYPYVHDEIARHVPAMLTTPHVLIGGWLAFGAGWLLLDVLTARAERAERGDSARSGATRSLRARVADAATTHGRTWAALVVIACLGTWWMQRTTAPPYSRLDTVPAAMGWSLFAAALGGMLLLARSGRRPSRSDDGRTSVPIGALLTLPLVTLALYVPRVLPSHGLYYYARYLVPFLLPTAILLATELLRRVATGANLRGPRVGLTILGAVGVAAGLSHVLVRSLNTRMVEFEGADAAIDDLAARLSGGIVVAGGEGWHSGFTFNQVGGALQLRHTIAVVPYLNREAAHGSLLSAARSHRRLPFLLINEASHHYTRSDGEIIAAADDLISAPLIVEEVHLIEVYTHLLTPDPERAPVRVTRQGLRAALIKIGDDDDTLLQHAVLATPEEARLAGVRAEGLAQISGGLCLDPVQPLVLPVDAAAVGDGPIEITIIGTTGSSRQTPHLDVRLDGRKISAWGPGDGERPRDTLGPMFVARAPGTIEIRGAPGLASSVCLHGGVSEIMIGPPPRSALSSAEVVTATAYTPREGFGQPYKVSGWVSGRALTQRRPGTTGMQPHTLSMRVDGRRPLRFAAAPVPESAEHDVVVTMTGSSLDPAARVELWVNGSLVERFDPPDRIRGSWQGPKSRVAHLRRSAEVELRLVGARPGDHLDVRDVAFFAVQSPVLPRVVTGP